MIDNKRKNTDDEGRLTHNIEEVKQGEMGAQIDREDIHRRYHER